jgi:energy-coupling factor transport system ATP-binding protein
MLSVSVEEEIIFGLENLGLARAVIRDRLEETLTRFGLQGLRARSPWTLSGGEQQKLALAAITARQPAVLVLDEPLSMLDSTAAGELVAHLADLSRAGTTLVVCEHRAEYLQPLPNLRTIQVSAAKNVAVPRIVSRAVPFSGRVTSAVHLQVSQLRVELGGRAILKDLNLAADGGQVIAVVGRNGVGKTTLLRALAGLQAYEGSIAVNGELPDFGLVFQNADMQLFNATVREEILFKLSHPDMERYHWLLDTLGLRAYEETPPLLLSEGEKKRVALAMVLMRGPPHGLLLDEPALGQDTTHKDLLTHLLRALAGAGQLVVMTTHDLTLAAHADRLVLLGRDGFVADGAPLAILRRKAPWDRLGLSLPNWLHIPEEDERTDSVLGDRRHSGAS